MNIICLCCFFGLYLSRPVSSLLFHCFVSFLSVLGNWSHIDVLLKCIIPQRKKAIWTYKAFRFLYFLCFGKWHMILSFLWPHMSSYEGTFGEFIEFLSFFIKSKPNLTLSKAISLLVANSLFPISLEIYHLFSL